MRVAAPEASCHEQSCSVVSRTPPGSSGINQLNDSDVERGSHYAIEGAPTPTRLIHPGSRATVKDEVRVVVARRWLKG